MRDKSLESAEQLISPSPPVPSSAVFVTISTLPSGPWPVGRGIIGQIRRAEEGNYQNW